MILDERIDFGVDGRLQHPACSLTDDFIERTPVVELLAKGKHLGIDSVRLWNVPVVCRSLAHGVSLCPIRAAEVWLPQQDTPLFPNSSRTQVLTIARPSGG